MLVAEKEEDAPPGSASLMAALGFAFDSPRRNESRRALSACSALDGERGSALLSERAEKVRDAWPGRAAGD